MAPPAVAPLLSVNGDHGAVEPNLPAFVVRSPYPASSATAQHLVKPGNTSRVQSSCVHEGIAKRANTGQDLPACLPACAVHVSVPPRPSLPGGGTTDGQDGSTINSYKMRDPEPRGCEGSRM
ncbi:hypothetical protein B0T11DRAFT_292972 [Plectosphaerella cucumerina]|uniref:Uncharacterized protein n=1 Tax=Plectosphaerella cucumerina TaxID=40658 RepID=A0A8K0TRE0_9PEZI|nr:hypothetical protein B0T11DRAFT_292972 [Plectosphaerella cucumerina]